MLNKYSHTITQCFLGSKIYIHECNDLVAIIDHNKSSIFVTKDTLVNRKKVMECIYIMYEYKYKKYKIEESFDLNNLLD